MATKTKALEPARRLSLFEVEAGWIPLLEDRIAAETDPELSDERPTCTTCGGVGTIFGDLENPSATCPHCEGSGSWPSPRERAIEAADVALAEHSTARVEKADSYIGLLGYLEGAIGVRRAVVDRNTTAVRILEKILDQVKATALFVMTESGRPRLEGSSGYLLAKKNGGLAPLFVDETLIPDDATKVEGWIAGGDYARMLAICRRELGVPEWRPMASLRRIPDNTGIRAKLAERCLAITAGVRCSDGRIPNDGPAENWPACPSCGGSGTNAVPGAQLGERGFHLEVK